MYPVVPPCALWGRRVDDAFHLDSESAALEAESADGGSAEPTSAARLDDCRDSPKWAVTPSRGRGGGPPDPRGLIKLAVRLTQ